MKERDQNENRSVDKAFNLIANNVNINKEHDDNVIDAIRNSIVQTIFMDNEEIDDTKD